jgi:hypothetical protein
MAQMYSDFTVFVKKMYVYPLIYPMINAYSKVMTRLYSTLLSSVHSCLRLTLFYIPAHFTHTVSWHTFLYSVQEPYTVSLYAQYGKPAGWVQAVPDQQEGC